MSAARQERTEQAECRSDVLCPRPRRTVDTGQGSPRQPLECLSHLGPGPEQPALKRHCPSRFRSPQGSAGCGHSHILLTPTSCFSAGATAVPVAQLGAAGLPMAGPFSRTFLGSLGGLLWFSCLFHPQLLDSCCVCSLGDPGQPGGHKHPPPKSGLRFCLPAAPSFPQSPLGTWLGPLV